ncbi:MAG: type II and III secretion system family protein, partial [Alphaproteobacteria bacterium]|nr:type II and III secretion system family protein [Alphaproteobacteria bacterium]
MTHQDYLCNNNIKGFWVYAFSEDGIIIVNGTYRFFRVFCIIIVVALSTVSLGSCELAKNQMVFDRAAEKDIQDYRDALAPQPPPASELANIPEFQPFISTPEELKLPSPLVTVSVNQTVSLRDLMFELAEQSGVDLEMDPQVRGSIIFTAKERPFNEVVDRICEMSGLRYKFRNDVLRVEIDRPYIKNYKIDYMNVARKSSSGISTNISVGSDASSASSSSGSNSNIDNTYSGDFWKELDQGLKQLLLASDTYLSLATLADPVATPVPAYVPPPPPVDPNNPNALPPLTAATTPPSLNVSLPPVSSEPLIPNAPATYSISKQSGIISVFASERQQKQVQKFINTLRRISMTQILIEARVLEVTLSDEFATGIDWGNINLTGLVSLQGLFESPGFATPSTNVFKANIDLGSGFRPVINALSRFGTVRALSSPRVTVMNNQPAVVNVTNNKVYFEIITTQTPSAIVGGDPTITKTGTTKTAPEGVLMNVVPTANIDTGEIILVVRPTVSKISNQVDDPVNAGNKIPELSVQEIDSIVKMQSGQTLVMGGLMKDQNIVG